MEHHYHRRYLNFTSKNVWKRLVLLLIRKHCGIVNFWSDLASCHYSKVTLEKYRSMNPPNCPEFWPIEKYWPISKQWLWRSGRYKMEERRWFSVGFHWFDKRSRFFVWTGNMWSTVVTYCSISNLLNHRSFRAYQFPFSQPQNGISPNRFHRDLNHNPS